MEQIKSVLISADESVSSPIPTSSDEVIRKKKELAAERSRAYRNRLDEEQKEAIRLKDSERKALQRATEKEQQLLLAGN